MKNSTTSADSFHSPTPSPARFLLLPFLWTRGWRAARFPLHSGLAREREREIKSNVVSGKGSNNSQVIVIIIIVRKKKVLITVICCCANRATSIYSLISLKKNHIHTIYLKLESRNHSQETTLNLFCAKRCTQEAKSKHHYNECLSANVCCSRWRVCCRRDLKSIRFLFIAPIKGNTQRAAWEMIGS